MAKGSPWVWAFKTGDRDSWLLRWLQIGGIANGRGGAGMGDVR